jgi:hypothetical protein
MISLAKLFSIFPNGYSAPKRMHPFFKRMKLPLRIAKRKRHISVFVGHLAHPAGYFSDAGLLRGEMRETVVDENF